jgi:Na+-driven multidrug efflux pump
MSAYGETAVTAMGIAHKIAMIPMYVSMGISQGVMPLVGYNYSARNPMRTKKAVKYTTAISVSFLALMSTLLVIFADDVIRAFMENPEVVEYGTAFMRAQAPAQVFLCMDFLAVGVFQACGMGLMSLVFAILRKVVLEIPALIVLDKLFPMYGIAYAQLVAEFVLAVAAVFFLVRILKKFERECK